MTAIFDFPGSHFTNAKLENCLQNEGKLGQTEKYDDLTSSLIFDYQIDINDYINFDDNFLEDVILKDADKQATDDSIVPVNKECDRSSSVTPSNNGNDLALFDHMYADVNGAKLKCGSTTINTIRSDSGSTCNISASNFSTELLSPVMQNAKCNETYQNLEDYVLQGSPILSPAFHQTRAASSSISSTDSVFTYVSDTSTSYYDMDSHLEDNSRISRKRSRESTLSELNFSANIPKTIETIETDICFGSDRYGELRRKNNMASRVSRKTRKEKQKDMERKADELERENEKLRVQVRQLDELTKELKQHFLNAILKKK